MFALTVSGFWFGQPSAFTAAQEALRINPSGGPMCPPFNPLDVTSYGCGGGGIIGQIGLSNLLVAAVILVLLTFQGFSAVFIIPIIILTLVLNIFILPFGFLYTLTNTAPAFISIPLEMMFNLLTITAIITFVKGGE